MINLAGNRGCDAVIAADRLLACTLAFERDYGVRVEQVAQKFLGERGIKIEDIV